MKAIDTVNEVMHERQREIMAKFPNAQERMLMSPLFHAAILLLITGSDPLKVIDQLINVGEDYQKKFEEYVKIGPPPTYIVVTQEVFDDLQKKAINVESLTYGRKDFPGFEK